jgi:hypothetical protein
VLDENRARARGADPAEAADDDRATARRGLSDHDARAASIPRLRDDPAGRRSLTGLELRRQRSRRTS